MYRKRPFFITFEGIEGSGKTYQSKKLFNNLKKEKLPVVFTREPGGSKSAEIIRRVILSGSKKKFNKYTDTLLYLAARSEHVENNLIPNLLKKKIIICDRFIDSTLAYQGYGKKVNLKLVHLVHKYILKKISPNLTFVLKVNIKKSFERINKRKTKNRYDKFTSNFYRTVQEGFIKIVKKNKNKNKYIILDNSDDSKEIEKIILRKVKLNLIK